MTTLLSHYWQPDLPPEIRKMMLNDWVDDLSEFPPEIVAAACNEWRRAENKQRPLPGDIRAECIARAKRAAGRLEQRKELTEDEIAELADKWARHHGHDSMADMQRSKEFRGGYLPIAPGRFRKFAPIREPEPPIAVEPIPTPVVQLKTKSVTPSWIVERDSKREDQKNEEAGKLEHVRSLVDMLIDRQQRAPEADAA